MQRAFLRMILLIFLLTSSSCEKSSVDAGQWNYCFDLSGLFQVLDTTGPLQAIVFEGDTLVSVHQVTPGDPVIETEPRRLPPGFGGARGAMVGVRIDSLSALISYAATVSYDQSGWALDARTYYYNYGEAFDILDLWGMYTDKTPDYRPQIFDPLLRMNLDTIAGVRPGAFYLLCDLNLSLIDQRQ